MTTLTITPNWKNKSARFNGTIAAGEHVAVSIANDDGSGSAYISSTTNLRLRVVDERGRTLAQFPMPPDEGETPDTWTSGTSELSCELNLNTVQMLAAVPPHATRQLLFVLDAYSEETPEFTLFLKDCHKVTHWPRRTGEEEPVNLDDYADLIEDFRERIDAAEDSIRDKVDEANGIVAHVDDARTAAENAASRAGISSREAQQAKFQAQHSASEAAESASLATAVSIAKMRERTGSRRWHNVALSKNSKGEWVMDVEQDAGEDGGLFDAEVKAIGTTDARSLAARFADTVNVMDFGAVGDGVADDTAAVQAAVDACKGKTVGGGYVMPKHKRVYLPAGKYKITGTIKLYDENVPRNISYDSVNFRHGAVEFFGDGVSTVIAPTFASDNHAVLSFNRHNGESEFLLDFTISFGMYMHDFCILGTNTSGQYRYCHGIALDSACGCKIERVMFRDVRGDGINVSARDVGYDHDRYYTEHEIRSCHFWSCNGWAIYDGNGGNAGVIDTITAHTCKEGGVRVSGRRGQVLRVFVQASGEDTLGRTPSADFDPDAFVAQYREYMEDETANPPENLPAFLFGEYTEHFEDDGSHLTWAVVGEDRDPEEWGITNLQNFRRGDKIYIYNDGTALSLKVVNAPSAAILCDKWSGYAVWPPFDIEIKNCESDINYVTSYWIARGIGITIRECHDYMTRFKHNGAEDGPFPSIRFGVMDSYAPSANVSLSNGGGATNISVFDFTSFGLHYHGYGTSDTKSLPGEYYRFELMRNCEGVRIENIFENFNSEERPGGVYKNILMNRWTPDVGTNDSCRVEVKCCYSRCHPYTVSTSMVTASLETFPNPEDPSKTLPENLLDNYGWLPIRPYRNLGIWVDLLGQISLNSTDLKYEFFTKFASGFFKVHGTISMVNTTGANRTILMQLMKMPQGGWNEGTPTPVSITQFVLPTAVSGTAPRFGTAFEMVARLDALSKYRIQLIPWGYAQQTEVYEGIYTRPDETQIMFERIG